MRRAASAALGAAAASLLLHPGPPGPVAWLALACALVLGAGLAMRGREPLLVASIAALAIAGRLAAAPGASLVERPLPDSDGPWRAVVESLSSPREGQQAATIRLLGPELRVAAMLPRFPAIAPGDRLTVDGALRPPPVGPYGDYLRRTGVAGTLRSRMLEVEAGEGVGAALEGLRRSASAALDRAIPEPEAGLAAGILIGLRDRVDRQLAADFTTAGASHVVAISGWNIAIVAASISALGGQLARRRRSILTAAAILAYVVFVGASPSVVRAAAMAGVVLLARESGRAGRAAAALGWAAALLLVAEPGLIRDAGFQLSTLATGGLIAWATPLSERIGRLGRGRLPGWLTEGLGVSLAAQAATLPIVLLSFGRLSVVAPAVNLAVVPLVAPAMAAGGMALAAGAVVAIPGVPDAVATVGGLPA
jgi:competence protein ComEC